MNEQLEFRNIISTALEVLPYGIPVVDVGLLVDKNDDRIFVECRNFLPFEKLIGAQQVLLSPSDFKKIEWNNSEVPEIFSQKVYRHLKNIFIEENKVAADFFE